MRGLLAKSKKTLFWASLLILALIFPSIPIVKASPETFGNTHYGDGQSFFIGIVGVLFPLYEDGVVESITLHCEQIIADWNPHIKCAIYHSNLSFICESEEWILTDAYNDWHTFNIEPNQLLTKGCYALFFWCDQNFWSRYDVVCFQLECYKTLEYNSFPDTLVPDGYEPSMVSIYATYTPTEGKFFPYFGMGFLFGATIALVLALGLAVKRR